MTTTQSFLIALVQCFLVGASLFYVLVILLLHSPVYGFVALRPIKLLGSPHDQRVFPKGIGQECAFLTKDGCCLHGAYFPVHGSSKVILVHHGNAGNIQHRYYLVENLNGLGFSVFLYDYRGFGLSDGKPSLDKLCLDGMAAYDYLRTSLGFLPEQIVTYGESIGCGVACEVLKKYPTSAVILQSPFRSLPDAARDGIVWLCAFPNFVFPQPQFSNLEYVKGPHPPLLLLHGMQDQLIPESESEILYKEASDPKKLVTFPNAGHNDMGAVDQAQYLQAIKEFMQTLK